MVQWLRLCTPKAGCMGSIPGWGTKILCATLHGQKTKQKTQKTSEKSQELSRDYLSLLSNSWKSLCSSRSEDRVFPWLISQHLSVYPPTVLRMLAHFSYIICGQRFWMVGRVPTSHSQNGSVLRDRLVQPPHFRVKETEAQKVEVICLWSSSRFVAETGLKSSPLYTSMGTASGT